MRQSSAGQTVLDMMKPCRSTEKLGEQQQQQLCAGGAGGGGANVKFDIWEEADQEQGASIGPGDCSNIIIINDICAAYSLKKIIKSSQKESIISPQFRTFPKYLSYLCSQRFWKKSHDGSKTIVSCG